MVARLCSEIWIHARNCKNTDCVLCTQGTSINETVLLPENTLCIQQYVIDSQWRYPPLLVIIVSHSVEQHQKRFVKLMGISQLHWDLIWRLPWKSNVKAKASDFLRIEHIAVVLGPGSRISNMKATWYNDSHGRSIEMCWNSELWPPTTQPHEGGTIESERFGNNDCAGICSYSVGFASLPSPCEQLYTSR
jgi:hypothetical protein